jgi:hypothetical protein
MNSVAAARPRPPFASRELLFWAGKRIEGWMVQDGLVVVRPGYMAFLPEGPAEHLFSGWQLAALASCCGPLSLYLAIEQWTRHAPQVEGWVTQEWTERRQEFDAWLRATCVQRGGFVWEASQASYTRSDWLGYPYVTFSEGKSAVRGVARAIGLDELLAPWQRIPVSPWVYVWPCLILSVLGLLIAAGGIREQQVQPGKTPVEVVWVTCGLAALFPLLTVVLAIRALLKTGRGREGPRPDA